MKPITLTLPIRIVSVANLREHHRPKARRTADHRGTVKLALWARCAELRKVLEPSPRLEHVRVVLCRQGVRRLDGDNLQSACKAARDGVADALGVDDADARIEWHYDQAIGPTYALHVSVVRHERTRSRKALEEARVRGVVRNVAHTRNAVGRGPSTGQGTPCSSERVAKQRASKRNRNSGVR